MTGVQTCALPIYITLYLGDIGLDITIDETAGKKTWLESADWQGMRKAVEAIMAINDHIELYFATNVIFEALVGEMFRNGFVLRAGPVNNDFVTPAVISAAGEDYRRNLANTVVLMKLLSGDETHGAANRDLMGGWLEKYVPLCVEAAAGMKNVWAMADTGDAGYDDALQQSHYRFKDILTELGLACPQV